MFVSAQGMMNNCWFRVKINPCRPHKGEIGLVFEHPTQPGNQPGGWMARQKHLEVAEAAAATGDPPEHVRGDASGHHHR